MSANAPGTRSWYPCAYAGPAPAPARRIPVAVQGGSGYGAGELLRLLGAHPGFEVTQVASRHHAGRPLPAVHRGLLGLTELSFLEQPDLAALLADGPAFLVSALPAGQSAAAIDGLLRLAEAAGPADPAAGKGAQAAPGWPRGLTVIDLSADLRPGAAPAGVEAPGVAALRAAARYGLVELGRASLAGAHLVANPGCFATALQLALAPLVAAGLTGFVAADGATGSSGSGALPSDTTHHPTRHSDYRAYRLEGHGHVAEVLAQFAAARLRLSFAAHSAPLVRGIHVTVHAPAESFPGALPDLAAVRDFYRDAPLVRVREDAPRVLDVAGSNFCDLTLSRHEDHVVVCAALDNLGKGMAGQAVQNMNLLAGYPEATGLLAPSVGPV